MDDFKKLTEQLFKIYINAESVNDLGIENYFDENISLIGTGKHEIFRNLQEFLESFKFDVKRRGKIRLEVRNLHQEEERLDENHVLAHGTVDFVGLFKDGSICFKMETRFTIIYKWTNGKWLVQHLHQSTPDLEQMEDLMGFFDQWMANIKEQGFTLYKAYGEDAEYTKEEEHTEETESEECCV